METLLVLAIETSGRAGSVAVVRGALPARADGAPAPSPAAILAGSLAEGDTSAVLAERAIDPSTRHGQALLPAIDGALADAGTDASALGLVACGLGPGSYTSLRIGLATGRTLAYALGLPVHGVSSFDVLALDLGGARRAALGDARSVLIAVDAFRDEVYVGRYRVEPSGLVALGEGVAVAPSEAMRGLEPPILVVGDGPARYPEAFADTGIRVAAADLAVPRARCLGAIAASAHLAGERQTPKDVLPLYLRPALPDPVR